MKNLKKNFGKYFVEFLIVAFGVFLGSYVNEWQNDKKDKKNKEKVIQNIITELESNKEKLQKAIDYHELINLNKDSTFNKLSKTKDFIYQRYVGNNEFKFIDIKGWVGVGFCEFDNTAFEVAKMSGTIQDIDIDLVQEISKTYVKINKLEDFQKIILNQMGGLNSDSRIVDVIASIQIIIGDNLGMEKSLLKKVDNTIKLIKNREN